MTTVNQLMKQTLKGLNAVNAAAPTGLRSTARAHLGPLTVNFGKGGAPTSATVRLGPLRYRVWDAKNRPSQVTSVDLPGPFSYRPPQAR